MITHRFLIADAQKAYEMIKTDGVKYLGVVFEYPADTEIVRRVNIETPTHKVASSEDVVKLGMVGAGNYAKLMLLPRPK